MAMFRGMQQPQCVKRDSAHGIEVSLPFIPPLHAAQFSTIKRLAFLGEVAKFCLQMLADSPFARLLRQGENQPPGKGSWLVG